MAVVVTIGHDFQAPPERRNVQTIGAASGCFAVATSVHILAEGAIALSVTLSGGALFAS